ncbi:Uncharacterized protein PBTT_00131 [Plasmodiophora brassicae]
MLSLVTVVTAAALASGQMLLDASEQQRVLADLNQQRAMLSMPSLTYCRDMEAQAAQLATRCPTPTDPTQPSLVGGSAPASPVAVQSAFASTTRVGCAKANCFGGIIIACVYNPIPSPRAGSGAPAAGSVWGPAGAGAAVANYATGGSLFRRSQRDGGVGGSAFGSAASATYSGASSSSSQWTDNGIQARNAGRIPRVLPQSSASAPWASGTGAGPTYTNGINGGGGQMYSAAS